MIAVSIGPVTEARILAAFADRAVLTIKDAAQLLGMDPKTLDAITEVGAIRAVRRGGGETRGYTEGDIRAYLTESAAPCRSTNPKPAPISTTTSRSVVLDFTARRALKRSAQLKR
jgi:hypothetical protein